MTKLFKRVVNVTLAPHNGEAGTALASLESGLGVDLSNLDCTFKAKKTLKADPNTCEVSIFNLAEGTRNLLAASDRLILRLEAGYEGGVAQLYLGEVRGAVSTVDGPDIITKVETGDSEKEIARNRISVSVGAKVPASQALTRIAEALKVGAGNVAQVAAKLPPNVLAMYGPGTILSGNAARALDDFCRSADLEWSIQDGVLQILDRGKALEDTAVLLSPSTGLVGSASVDSKGKIEATALINPDLRPGRKVEFATFQFNGAGYRIEEVEYTGDTRGRNWYAKIKCSPY